MHQRRLSFARARQNKCMKNPINSINIRSRYHIWFVVFALFGAWYFLLQIHDWSSLPGLASFAQSVEASFGSTNYDPVLDNHKPISTNIMFTNPYNSISNTTNDNGTIEQATRKEERIKKDDAKTELEPAKRTSPKDGTMKVETIKEEKEEEKPDERVEKVDRKANIQPFNTALPYVKTKSKKFDKVDPKPNPVLTTEAVMNIEEKRIDAHQRVEPETSACSDRYIYIHKIPREFNEELTEKCWLLNKWMNMCQYMDNMGLGQRLPGDRAFSKRGWFSTHQFSLEVIFHNRMKQYECLTDDSSKASAIFVPYYAGLDVARYLWGGYNASTRDSGSLELYKWLRDQPEWKAMSGSDHFLVAGRITWDFRRGVDEDSAWGNKLMILPESQNITMLTIESSPWNMNDFAIPYPTYFHPSKDADVYQWQNRMRKLKRRFLFSFAGAPRPNMDGSIRGEIMRQCTTSRRRCLLLECTNSGNRNKCLKPNYLMRMFESSEFCLQPPGDSFTRRSTFDSIISGCIPVFFHPASAYVQYLWHLPRNFNKYSVLISEEDVRDKKVTIEEELMKIPRSRVVAMREEVIKLIPKVIYADPRSRLERIEDAFDLTVKGVLNRVERARREMRGGRNSSEKIDEEMSWKYNFYGSLQNNEWDHYFVRTNNYRY